MDFHPWRVPRVFDRVVEQVAEYGFKNEWPGEDDDRLKIINNRLGFVFFMMGTRCRPSFS